MALTEFTFPSANEQTAVYAWKLSPLGRPRAAVQLIHGYAEHSRRYLHLALALQDAGFLVYADDHIGHGKTGKDAQSLGIPRSKDFLDYVRDERSLARMAASENPGLPLFLLGFSWGSMIARAFASEFTSAGDPPIAGVLCAALVQGMPGMTNVLDAPAFRRRLTAMPDAGNDGWFSKAFEQALSRFGRDFPEDGWIAVDGRITGDNAQDPYCVQESSMRLCADFLELGRFLEDPGWIARVPKGLPFFLSAGSDDPCSNFGEGAYALAEALRANGNPVRVKVWEGWRHEVHNELPVRAEFEAEIVSFINDELNNIKETEK